MKINNRYDLQRQYLENYKNKDSLKAKDKKLQEDPSVKVEISGSTKKLIGEINKSRDSGFSEKVEGIRKAVLEGKYTVSTEAIADKILSEIELEKGSGK